MRPHMGMDNEYRCSRCRATKPASDFYPRSDTASQRPVMYYCKVCALRASKESRERRDKMRPGFEARRSLRRWEDMTAEERYFRRLSKPSVRGLAREWFYATWEKQNGACAICQAELVQLFGKPVNFVVDHDHATGASRGILCPKCNLGLGHFDDNQERLLAAWKYLK